MLEKQCNKYIDGKRFVFSKSLTAVTSFWKWENIDRPCHSKDTGGIAEVYKKTVAVTKDIVVGDIMKSFHETLLKSKSSRNPKKKSCYRIPR